MPVGNAFHNFGAADLKLLSPYVTVLLGYTTSCFELFMDLRFLVGWYISKSSLIYDGARLLRALYV